MKAAPAFFCARSDRSGRSERVLGFIGGGAAFGVGGGGVSDDDKPTFFDVA